MQDGTIPSTGECGSTPALNPKPEGLGGKPFDKYDKAKKLET